MADEGDSHSEDLFHLHVGYTLAIFRARHLLQQLVENQENHGGADFQQ